MIAVLTMVMAASWCSTVAQGTPNQADTDTLPDGPGKTIVLRACLSCHNAKIATSKRISPDEWGEEIDKMVARGAVLSDDEIDLVVDYLSTHYGPSDSESEHSAAPETAAQPPSAQSPSSDKKVPLAPPGITVPSASSNDAVPLNVNKADVQELESALGLSKTEAEAIVQYRAKNGDFKTWQEVSSVPGVPPEKIKDNQKRLVF